VTTVTIKPVAFLPADSPLRAQVKGLLDVAEVPMVASEADVDIAIVDLTGPGADVRLNELYKLRPRLAVFGIADPARLTDPRVLEVVGPDKLDAELVARLGHLRARLATLREAQQRQRDLQVLIELTARYAEARDVEELMHDVTRRLAEEARIDRAAIVVVDEDGRSGTIVGASDDPSLNHLQLDLSRYPEIREAVRTAKPVIVEDAPSHPLLEDVKDHVAARDIRNIAAMPLIVRGKVLGVLLLRRSSDQGAFNPREVEFLTTVAHATAVAFRNVRRLESVRGQREKEKTARIAAEERAAELKRYEGYFEHLSDGVAILDSRACVLSLNPAGQALLDLDASQAMGRHINALTNPGDDGLLLDVLFAVSRGQVKSEVDLPARTVAGRRLVLSVSAAPLKGQSEGVAILTMRDVTRPRELANELRKTSEFLERLIDSSVDPIIAADLKGKVILFNKAAEQVFGYTAFEAINTLTVTDVYPDSESARDIMKKLRGEELGGMGRLTTYRVDIRAKDGERVPVNMTGSIIYEGGRELATVGIFTDLRDRLNLERKLSDAETRLLETEKNSVIVALAGTAAHELNQPLTSVMGYAELLKRKLKESDPAWRSVDIIHKEAERMAEIVRKIGKITRYETMSYVGQKQIVDLNKASAHED